MRKKIMIPDLYAKYEKGEPITMLTAYDYPMALLEEKAGVDIILVGDSMGMTVYGLDTTLPVTLDMIIRHAQAVRRGAPTAFIVGDMPYMTYQVNKDEAIRNAGRLMAEAGVDAIKLEGGREMAETIAAIVKATIPVMGHIGLTPQSISQLGGFKAQGRTAESALKLVEDAKALEAAGCFSILVEAVPPEVNKVIVETVKVPIISLGSGVYGAGQCLIVHDMLGFFDRFTPKFVKKYANLNAEIVKALEAYVADVKEKNFPGPEHVYPMSREEVEKFLAELNK
ncbi:3-methyl-2-oxobutanoate hydroxymethyltransferase [Desulfofundulus thermosubterraneus]|uniref:3-methyl-2-oxobutanoate hydroxymethyltransferase n=1 Tax=Desulfofundulus thermosubterraneus DSM 16057 TaxID=1121432 RepID=A0A1M6C042_9FIRM|nr:3-methyl-2-oxobutanoate hydroxymethyltransferase [Desulfofundulus thermosubterraneus]SHI54439.1 3-methyl-2-oxobutanoate hydroxymethyltransferase [Desulfofundulus thermosubterraneus DSM 16057]